MNRFHMIRQLDARYQTLSRKLNAISGRSIDHAAGGGDFIFNAFPIDLTDTTNDQTEAINDRLAAHGALFGITLNTTGVGDKTIKIVNGNESRFGAMKVWLTIRESTKLFMVEDYNGTTKAYAVDLTGNYPGNFDKLEKSTSPDGLRYRQLASSAMYGKSYTEPAIGSTYTCLTNKPYVTVYNEDMWVSRS